MPRQVNARVFPGCGQGDDRTCSFGGSVQKHRAFSQQFIYASSEEPSLRKGSGCAGDTADDPLGATFDQIYNGSLNYVVWNDQFYNDPPIAGCGTNYLAPWGHSKGVLAWNSKGEGLVLQVSTPSWPASGSKRYRRESDGNTLGCIDDNDVMVSQHFFALKAHQGRRRQRVEGAGQCDRGDRPVESPDREQRGGPPTSRRS